MENIPGKDQMTSVNVSLEKLFDMIEKEEEIKRLRRYETLVSSIAQEPLELSWEKIENQRTYWKKLCKNLLEQDYPPKEDGSIETLLDDNF